MSAASATDRQTASSGPASTPIPTMDPALVLADPHGVLRECRARGPVVSFRPRTAMVLHARNVLQLNSDPRTPQLPGAHYVEVCGIPDGVTTEFLKVFMLLTHGEDHARLRGSVSRIFAQPVMRLQRQRIRALVDGIVGDAPRGETFDYVETVASLVPAQAIADILGLPVSDVPSFRRLVYSLSRCLSAPYAIDAHHEIEDSAKQLFDYVREELEARRRAPRDDLLTTLVEMENRGARRRASSSSRT